MWEGFARTVLLPVRQAGRPFLPAVGNHDGSPGFEADRAAVRRFWTPRRQALGLRFVDVGDFPFHYSALQNDVFVLVWDASSSRIPASQLSWARQQLASPEARQARLRLVVGHLPLVGVSQGRDRAGEVLDQAAAVQSLLEQGRVQAYISGHQHAWFPARRGQLDLIQLGAMGSGPRRLLQGDIPPQQTYTTLDINWQNSSLVETTYAVASGQPVAWSRLPASLMGRSGPLNRNVQERSIRR
jgi:3',5'-cyclic AMP phosphodiesterase CpdA